MTALQLKAVEYFDEASKRAHRDVELKTALEIVQATYKLWTRKGWENCITGAAWSAMRWLYTWDTSGRVGGLPRFRNGLKNAMKWAALEIKPKSVRLIQGIESDGMPHVDKARGPFRAVKADLASGLVKRWNQAMRDEKLPYRFRVTTHRRCPAASGKRLILRYELVVPERVLTVSLDSEHNHERVWEDRGDARAGWLA